MNAVPTQLEDRIAQVQGRIAQAAERAGRDPDGVMLVAVTKGHSLETIQRAYNAGLRHFGENRVEEARDKFADLGQQLPDAVWHMIGHIQSRKTADVAESRFAWVHSVGRLKIARRLSDALPSGRTLNVLVQVNVSGEESKYGYDLARWPDDDAPAFFAEVEQILSLPRISVRGLMTLAPYSQDPEDARPTFQRLRALRDELARRCPGGDWAHLSAGMSGDYQVAIEEGATIVRIGTALFGPRQT